MGRVLIRSLGLTPLAGPTPPAGNCRGGSIWSMASDASRRVSIHRQYDGLCSYFTRLSDSLDDSGPYQHRSFPGPEKLGECHQNTAVGGMAHALSLGTAYSDANYQERIGYGH